MRVYPGFLCSWFHGVTVKRLRRLVGRVDVTSLTRTCMDEQVFAVKTLAQKKSVKTFRFTIFLEKRPRNEIMQTRPQICPELRQTFIRKVSKLKCHCNKLHDQLPYYLHAGL